LKRCRTEEKNAPAQPTSANTAVGFSGESVQPVCAWATTGIAMTVNAIKANRTILFSEIRNTLFIAQSFQCEGLGRVPIFVVPPAAAFYCGAVARWLVPAPAVVGRPAAIGVTTGTAAPMISVI